MNSQSALPRAPVTTSRPGKYLLFRKHGGGMRHTPRGSQGAGKPPRHRHSTFESAETEAGRLLGLFPESTFLILQEVGRVKLAPADPDVATGCADNQAFPVVPVEALREALA